MTFFITWQRSISNKEIFYVWDGFGYVFRMSQYILVTCPIFVFWNRGKLKLIQKPCKSWENQSNRDEFGRVTACTDFVACITFSLLTCRPSFPIPYRVCIPSVELIEPIFSLSMKNKLKCFPSPWFHHSPYILIPHACLLIIDVPIPSCFARLDHRENTWS